MGKFTNRTGREQCGTLCLPHPTELTGWRKTSRVTGEFILHGKSHNRFWKAEAFIAEKNPSSLAQKTATELLAGIAMLKELPHLGSKVIKTLNPEIMRNLSVDLYIVCYLIVDDEIHILRVRHKQENRPS